MAQHEENTRSLAAEIEAQQAAVTQNETACAEAEAAQGKAEAELNTYNAELAELGESTGSLTAERERITNELSENQMQRLANEKDIGLHEAALEGLQSRTGEAEARARELNAAIEAAKAKIEANALKIAEIERTRGEKPACVQRLDEARDDVHGRGVRRVEHHDVKRRARKRARGRQTARVSPRDREARACGPQRGGIAAHARAGAAVEVDERRVRGPAAQELEPQGARAGEGVEHARAIEREAAGAHEHGRDRLAHAVRRGPRDVAALRRLDGMTLPLSANDPHASPLSPLKYAPNLRLTSRASGACRASVSEGSFATRCAASSCAATTRSASAIMST